MNIWILIYILIGIVLFEAIRLLEAYDARCDLKREIKQCRKNIEVLEFAIKNRLEIIEEEA